MFRFYRDHYNHLKPVRVYYDFGVDHAIREMFKDPNFGKAYLAGYYYILYKLKVFLHC